MPRFNYPLIFITALLTGWGMLSSLLAETKEVIPIMEMLPPELEANLVNPLEVPKSSTFAEGEHLKFKLGWSMFKVANATLSCEPEVYQDKHPAIKISLETRTNSFADAIYRVRNLSTSWIADDVSRSFEYTAVQDENGRKRDSSAIFDTESLTGHHVNRLTNEEKDLVEILPGTFDPLGIVFFLRCLDYDVGDELVIPTSNGKEFFYTIVHVRKKVRKKFKYGGRQEAWVLEPDIKDVGGVFKRSPDGRIRFYISADERKLPLRMESEVAVGSFWAELVDIVDVPSDDSVAIAEIE